MKKTRHEKFLKKVLNKMFSMVGKKYSPEFCEKAGWWLKSSWTKEQEENFKQFYIKTARKDLRLSKFRAEKEFMWFNLMFGWKQKD